MGSVDKWPSRVEGQIWKSSGACSVFWLGLNVKIIIFVGVA